MADFYFGNLATGLQKRPAPETGMGASPVGESESMSFTNGGAFVSQSEGTHREFDLSWGVQEKSAMNFLSEYRNGVYGTGLLYMVDPFATNVLPPHWANPGLTCKGWPSLLNPAVQPVVAPAAVVTNLATNPSFETAGAISTIRINLMMDPQGQATANPWTISTAGGTATLTVETTGGPVGIPGWRKAVFTAVPTTSPVQISTSSVSARRFTATAGTTYTASVYVISDYIGFASTRCDVTWYDSAGAVVGSAAIGPAAPLTAPNAWERRSNTVVAPAGAVTGLVRASFSNGQAMPVGTYIGATGVLVEDSTLVNDFFDGSTINTTDYTYVWSGTAFASTSLLRALSVVGASGSASQAVAHQSSDNPRNGGKFARWVVKSTGPIGLQITDVPVPTTGAIVTLKLWARATTRDTQVAPRVRDARGPIVTLKKGVWTELTLTTAAGSGTASQTGLVINAGYGHQLEDYIDIDGHILVEGTYTGPYFDGSTVFIDGNKGAWTGVVDASTSTLARTPGNMPNTGARYTLTGEIGSVPTRMLTLMIPEDRDLYLGFSGTATNGGVLRMRTITRDGAYGPVQDLTLLDPTGNTRLNTKVAGGAYRAVQVYMTTTLPGAATITLVSGKAIYALPTETPDLTGGHTEGEGHTGVRFDGAPTMVYVQAAKGRKLVSTAAKFTEVGAWL